MLLFKMYCQVHIYDQSGCNASVAVDEQAWSGLPASNVRRRHPYWFSLYSFARSTLYIENSFYPLSSYICTWYLHSYAFTFLFFFVLMTSHYFFIKYYLIQKAIWLLRYWLVAVRQNLSSFKDSVKSLKKKPFFFIQL